MILQLTNRKRLFPHQTPGLNDDLTNRWCIRPVNVEAKTTDLLQLEVLRYKTPVTICPCCGFKSDAELSAGCAACGSCPVGEALPKPEHELPSYGRSLVLSVMGALLVLVFVT